MRPCNVAKRAQLYIMKDTKDMIMNPSLKEKSDEEVLALSISSPSLFEELVNRYEEAFLRKARSIVGNREEVFDIVQDTFTKIYLNAGRFKMVDGGSFKAWGYRILVNTSLTYYQKFKKYHERNISLEQEIMESLPDHEPITIQKSSFFEEEVVMVCSKMPRNLSKIFRLYFMDGKSHKEIAKDEGITEGAAKTKISRAKKEFKKVMLDSNPIL
jgi:RNA polymerase sigma factor (sigma-70 family)